MLRWDDSIELTTAADLRKKLRRSLDRYTREPTDLDAFFDFLATAEHLADWIHPGEAGRPAREAIRAGSILAQVCSKIVLGGRHFRIEAIRLDRASEMRKRGLDPSGPYPKEPTIWGKIIIHLHGDAAAQLGPTIEAADFARRLHAFWLAQPLK